LPDRHGGSELSEPFEVVPEHWLQSLAKVIGTELH